MRTRVTIFIYLCLIATLEVAAQQVIYQPADSLRITQLLREGISRSQSTCLPLYYGKQFIGIPYVASTLEVNYVENPQTAHEQLIVNTREMDCTTFVETVCALTLTTRQRSTSFADYCRNLQRLRYRGGIIDGYASRNHYFSTWIDNAEALGIAREIGQEDSPLFSSTKQQVINYMTTHPNQYPALRNEGGSIFLPAIRAAERAITRTEHYIPTSKLHLPKAQLNCVEDGDILAMVTSKAGLDVSHLGLAVWGEDGRLHLLNASSLHHKVVLEQRTLQQYQQSQKTQLGIRVIRLKD